MKSKFTTFILTLVMLFLLCAIFIIGGIIYLDITSSNVSTIYEFQGDSNVSDDGDSENKPYKTTENQISITGKLQELFSNNEQDKVVNYNYSGESSESNYFYKQLNEYEKKIYNGLQENKTNMQSGTYVIGYGDAFSDLLSKDNGSEVLGEYYQAAIEAFTHDNMDLFYLNVNKLYLNIETTKKLGKTKYNVYIAPEANGNYYADGFSSQEQVASAMNEIEMVKESIISSLSGNKYKDILKIHDFLVDNIEYDTTYSSIGIYSIYGALVKKTCVCEGYAKAFKYLANAAGIESEIMQGTAINSSGDSESHAWNCVYIDNAWYQIDITWDDPIVIGGGKLLRASKYKYFLKGTNTFKQDHTASYQFTEGGKIFSYPDLNAVDYK